MGFKDNYHGMMEPCMTENMVSNKTMFLMNYNMWMMEGQSGES